MVGVDAMRKALLPKRTSLGQKPLVLDINVKLTAIRYRRFGASKMSFRLRLMVLDSNLKLRSTSKQSDEAVCVGSILGLAIEKLLDIEDHTSRMRELWRQLAAGPWGIFKACHFPFLAAYCRLWLLVGTSYAAWARSKQRV